VKNFIATARITTPVILVSLVYLRRAKPYLNIALKEWAMERVFLGTVIIAAKVCLLYFDIAPC
jgi:hypothetical protein